jgi:hypothetical protein
MALIFRLTQAACNNNDLSTAIFLKMTNNVLQKLSSLFLRGQIIIIEIKFLGSPIAELRCIRQQFNPP